MSWATSVAVVVDTGAEGERLRVARSAPDELLLARELEPDRPACGEHEVADDVLDQHLLLAAEAAADARLDHADALHGKAEQRRHHAADMERHLGRGAQDEAIVARRASRSSTCGSMRACCDALDVERLLEDVVGRCERGLDVVGRSAPRCGRDVAGGVDGCPTSRPRRGQRGARRDRLERVEDCGEHLVGDLDAPACLLGDLDGVGRHRRDPVADVANLVVEAHLVPRIGVRPALASRGVFHPRGVAVVERLVHARHRPAPRCRRSRGSGRGRGGCAAPWREAVRAARCRR